MPKLPPNIEAMPSGNYRGRYLGPDGRRHSTAPYARWEQAQWALEQARADMARGDWIDPERAGITLNRWFDLWAEKTAAARQREYVLDKERTRYRLHIRPYLGSMELGRITTFTVTSWHSDLARDGRNPATIKKAHALLKSVLGPRGGAMSDERIRVNPCSLVQPPQVMRKQWRLVTTDEFQRILSEIPERWQPVVILAVYTGLRWSEIVGLQRCDYNAIRQEITVRRGTVHYKGQLIDDDPKDHEERTVPLHPKVTTALNVHLERTPRMPAARLFTATQGGTLRHPHFMERIYKPAVKRAGLTGVRFHDLRHSCASWLLNGGMDIHEVKELLGHASITTTQLYAHTDKDELRDAMLKAFGG